MTTTDSRCPQCGALVRSELLCGLCHADLRPAPVPVPVSLPVAVEPPAPTELPDLLDVTPTQAYDPLVDPLPPAAWIAPLTRLPQSAPNAAVAARVDPVAPEVAGLEVAGLTPGEVPAPRGKHARPVEPGSAASAPSAGIGAEAGNENEADNEAELAVAFAMLRAESRDPFLSKAQATLSSPGARIVAIVGGAVGLTAVLFVLFLIVGTVAG